MFFSENKQLPKKLVLKKHQGRLFKDNSLLSSPLGAGSTRTQGGLLPPYPERFRCLACFSEQTHHVHSAWNIA